MDCSPLDTRPWNLTVGVAMTVVAAAVVPSCGPTIFLEGETDSVTDGDDSDDTPPVTNTTTATTTVGGACMSSEQCEPGQLCIDGMCVYYDPYDDSCLDYCCDDECCYDYCDYIECYSDGECGSGWVCTEFGECQPVPVLPECGDLQLGSQTLPLRGPEDIISLAYLDANGDELEDLFIGRHSGATLALGAGGPVVDLMLPEGGVPVYVAAGDIDGDGLTDLVYSDGGGELTALVGDGTGNFSLLYSVRVGPILDLAVLDWNGDGRFEVATILGTGATTIVGDDAGMPVELVYIQPDEGHASMAVGRIDGDAYDDLVLQDGFEGFIFQGGPEGDGSPDWSLVNELSFAWSRQLMAGDIDGGGGTTAEIIGLTEKTGGWTLLEAWRDAGGWVEYYAIGYRVLASDLGDIDGDGVTDVVMSGQDRLTVVQGYPSRGIDPILLCEYQFALGVAPVDLAVGDFDGDGRGDVAFTDGGHVYLYASQR